MSSKETLTYSFEETTIHVTDATQLGHDQIAAEMSKLHGRANYIGSKPMSPADITNTLATGARILLVNTNETSHAGHVLLAPYGTHTKKQRRRGELTYALGLCGRPNIGNALGHAIDMAMIQAGLTVAEQLGAIGMVAIGPPAEEDLYDELGFAPIRTTNKNTRRTTCESPESPRLLCPRLDDDIIYKPKAGTQNPSNMLVVAGRALTAAKVRF
jgi:hypothetical protein